MDLLPAIFIAKVSLLGGGMKFENDSMCLHKKNFVYDLIKNKNSKHLIWNEKLVIFLFLTYSLHLPSMSYAYSSSSTFPYFSFPNPSISPAFLSLSYYSPNSNSYAFLPPLAISFSPLLLPPSPTPNFSPYHLSPKDTKKGNSSWTNHKYQSTPAWPSTNL